jgi:hypothetical protein
MSWDFENAKQLELQLEDTREDWQKNGFKTKEEWVKACYFDREFNYLTQGGNHFDYLTKTS